MPEPDPKRVEEAAQALREHGLDLIRSCLDDDWMVRNEASGRVFQIGDESVMRLAKGLGHAPRPDEGGRNESV